MAGTDQEAALQWGTIDLSDLLAGLGPLEDIISTLNNFVDLLSTVLDILKTAIEVASALLIGCDDILKTIYEALSDLIIATVQQLTQTGVYNVIHYPPSISAYITPQEWCSTVGSSLFDRMDNERPILVDPSAYVCGVALVTTSDNLKDLMSSWNSFCSMLGMFVKDLFSQIDGWPDPGDPFEVTPGVGQVPNWKSVKLADILPCMNQAADYLMGLLDSMKPTNQKSVILSQFADFLDAKIKVIQMYGQKILAVIGLVNAILNIEGLYTLVISGQGDTSWFRERLSSATGGPHDYGKYDSSGNLLPEDQQKEATFTLGTVFLITGGSTAAVDILSSFFEGIIFPIPNPDVPQIPDLP